MADQTITRKEIEMWRGHLLGLLPHQTFAMPRATLDLLLDLAASALSHPAALERARAEERERCAAWLEERADGFSADLARHVAARDCTEGRPISEMHSRRACTVEATIDGLLSWAAGLRALGPAPIHEAPVVIPPAAFGVDQAYWQAAQMEAVHRAFWNGREQGRAEGHAAGYAEGEKATREKWSAADTRAGGTGIPWVTGQTGHVWMAHEAAERARAEERERCAAWHEAQAVVDTTGDYIDVAGARAHLAFAAAIRALGPAPSPEAPPLYAMPAPSRAALDVLAERRRQVEVEGYDAEHDDTQGHEELASAAAAYAAMPDRRVGGHDEPLYEPEIWPWASRHWKPRSDREDLVRAGALILAAIECIDRALLAELEGSVKP